MKLGKKKVDELQTDVVENEIAQEQEVLKNDDVESFPPEAISTDKLEKALTVLTNRFNLSEDGYQVIAFADKGNSCILTLSNGNFTLNVKIHDCEANGII